MTRSPDTLVKQFIDGTLHPEEEAEALRRIAADSEARALLRFERQMARTLSGDPHGSRAVPPGFSDRVMQAVAEVEMARSRSAFWDSFRAAWNALIQPRPVRWRPVYVLPVLLGLLAVGLWIGEPATTPDTPATPVTTVAQEEGPALVRFMFVDDEARQVAVAGDFNYWEPVSLTPQEAGGRTVWTTLMAVPPGEHRYMFVIDGEEWVTDPLAPQVRDDGFGNANAILSL